MTVSLKDRTSLNNRHRLSHKQIDTWFNESLSKEFLQEKFKQLDAVKTFLWLTDLIRDAGISFISLKGPLLSHRIYNDPTVRISHDIDILIEIFNIEPVIEILKNNGYSFSEGVFWPRKVIHQEMILNTYHHLNLTNKDRDSCIEIHWVLMNNLPVSKSKMNNLVSENILEMDFAGRKFTVLNKEMELLFLLIHGSRHGWSRLKWLVDIKDYPIHEIDFAVFQKLRSKLKANRIIGQTNYFLNIFFQTQLPFSGDAKIPDFFIQFARKSIDDEIKGVTLPLTYIISLYRYKWFMFKGFHYKIKLISSILFRPNDISSIDSSFKIIYLLYRPFSFIKRRFKNVK
jgi:hypothetical protein